MAAFGKTDAKYDRRYFTIDLKKKKILYSQEKDGKTLEAHSLYSVTKVSKDVVSMKQPDGTLIEVDALKDIKNCDRGPDDSYYFVMEIMIGYKDDNTIHCERLFTLYTRSDEDRNKFMEALNNKD